MLGAQVLSIAVVSAKATMVSDLIRTSDLIRASGELDENAVTPGVIGFFAIFFVAAATVLLVFDMVRRVRRTRYRGEIAERLDAEQADADQAHADQAAADRQATEQMDPDRPGNAR